MPRQLLFLELNEVNFESVRFYCAHGELPNLQRLIQECGWAITHSETRYEELEPWIQWVTAHTGKTLAQHGVFRLGDIVKHDIPQIWEELERHGLRVGAISPMNAKHRLRNPAFFVPDPWTRTGITADRWLRRLYDAIAQAVNDNAQAKVTPRSALNLLFGLIRYGRPQNYAMYVQLIASALSKPWRRAILLDVLLADVFIRETQRSRPQFATLFLNAAAHIQHHYLFSSASYSGPSRNPDWYLPRGIDPVAEIYRVYDRIVGQVRRSFPDARLMIATGLHQEPHGEVTFYWRLADHARFLRKIGVSFARVEPRMSRDFLIVCESAQQAAEAEHRLASAVASDGTPLFSVDNRGSDLFVMLTYPKDITRDFVFSIGQERFVGLRDDVAFVALKNGEHHGDGYFIDSEADLRSTPHFPLTDLPRRIMQALGISPDQEAPDVETIRARQSAGAPTR
jgi:hypothetical protein